MLLTLVVIIDPDNCYFKYQIYMNLLNNIRAIYMRKKTQLSQDATGVRHELYNDACSRLSLVATNAELGVLSCSYLRRVLPWT